jgi:Rod binding domain-containing protein
MGYDATISLLSGAPALHQMQEGAGRKATREQKARAQADQFEQVYLSTMMKQMFAGVSAEAPFGGGQAEESWRGLLVDQYAATMQKSGGIGISDMVYRDLIGLQEGASK